LYVGYNNDGPRKGTGPMKVKNNSVTVMAWFLKNQTSFAGRSQGSTLHNLYGTVFQPGSYQQDLNPIPSACSSLVIFWASEGQGGIILAATLGYTCENDWECKREGNGNNFTKNL